MREKVIEYFSNRHLLTNFIFVGIFISGIFFWFTTGKEELPDLTMDRVRIYANYPGASSEEVEHFVTRPIEDELRGIDGIYRITSNSSIGYCTINIELEHDYRDKDESISEIRKAVMDVDLPLEIIEEPRVRVFKTSKKAIVDICLYQTGKHLLDFKSRSELQAYAHSLENQLFNLPEVNSINKSGYIQEELQILVHPGKLIKYGISFNGVINEIKNSNIRQPAGSLENIEDSKVTLISELDNSEKLEDLVIQGSFEGNFIRLRDIADVRRGYKKEKSILKINGHEGVILNVVKNSSYGIVDAIEAVDKVVKRFKENNLSGNSIKIAILDDESAGVRNRLSIIGLNGGIGFILILIMLFIFLNFRSGIWVAMGIPFTFCFTMIFINLMGYSINNITLAGVIIVMGMVVDDAIVVAENISRLRSEGVALKEAVVRGTTFVFLPVVASIVTTCIAFLPILSFTGRSGMLIKHIPPIVILMLVGSLIESILILPAHINLNIPRPVRVIFSLGLLPLVERYYSGRNKESEKNRVNDHWFYKLENVYAGVLRIVLRHKLLLFLLFTAVLVLSGFIFVNKMKYVMFPREETTEIRLVAKAPSGTKRLETAKLSKEIENVFSKYMGKEVVGFRTVVAKSRFHSTVEENKLSMRIEIVPREERDKSLNMLIHEWKRELDNIKGFKEIDFTRRWFGQSSGSPIEIMVYENDDKKRDGIVAEISGIMKKHPELESVEIDQPIKNPEYKIDLKRNLIKRLGINPVNIGSTFRAILEGSVLYKLKKDDEEIHVRLSAANYSKNDINEVLNIPVENRGEYLVPLNKIVDIKKEFTPGSISRQDFKRKTSIFADMRENAELTPLEIAEYFEAEIFPGITSRFPTSIVSFGGEVKDTRESQSDLMYAVIMVVFSIYVILVLLLNSLVKPLMIMLAIPFGVVGIILAFWGHGITTFGFFAAVGALGLTGVVVNDSILMIVKLDSEFDNKDKKNNKSISNSQIAHVAKTRLRAVVLTTFTTVAGLLPTAYGLAGYDSMLAEMMLAMAWGLLFGTTITLLLIPSLYSLVWKLKN